MSPSDYIVYVGTNTRMGHFVHERYNTYNPEEYVHNVLYGAAVQSQTDLHELPVCTICGMFVY